METCSDLHVDPIWGQRHACNEEGWNCVIPTMVRRFLVGDGSDACTVLLSFSALGAGTQDAAVRLGVRRGALGRLLR